MAAACPVVSKLDSNTTSMQPRSVWDPTVLLVLHSYHIKLPPDVCNVYVTGPRQVLGEHAPICWRWACDRECASPMAIGVCW